MLQWLVSNIWTIIICIVLIGIVAAIIINMVRKKKQGRYRASSAWYLFSFHSDSPF